MFRLIRPLFTLVAVSFAITTAAHAQVQATLATEPTQTPLSAGAKFAAQLTVAIDPGWHIASLTQPDGGPMRSEISLAPKQFFKLAGPITGPKPRFEHSDAFGINVETHEGTVVFTLPLEATNDVPPGTILAVDFTYQACSDENCALPATDRLTAVIGSPTKPRSRASERETNTASEASELKVDPAVHWGRLDNGIRYAVLPNPEPKGRASLRFTIMAGSLHESEDQRGLAHFLEHLAFNGSAHFPPGTLVEYFQRLGMSFGGDTNAHTGFDETVYDLELPDTKPKTVEQALTLFADYGGGLLLQPESIEKERGIILSEKRARDSVAFRQYLAEFAFMLPEARFTQRIPIGLPAVIESAPRERFMDYYDTWYRPENMIVVAVGDFDPTAVATAIKAAMSPLKARAPARPAPDLGRVIPVDGNAAKLHPEPEAPAVHIAIKTITPHTPEPDTAERRLKYLPRSIALAMLNRRLSILAKKEGAPFLSASASVSENYDFFRQASISLTCQPEQWNAALAVGDQELRRALQHGFQPAELSEVVSNFRNGLEQAVNTTAARRSGSLANALLESIKENRVFMHPKDVQALYAPALETITVADCLVALRDAFDEKTGRKIFMTGNLTLGDAEKQIVAAYGDSKAVAVTAPEKIEEIAFAYTDFGPAGEVAVRQEVRDLGVTLLEFKNGVRLNLKPTDFEPGRVGVSIRVGGGKLTEPTDKPGLGMFTSSIFLAGGLGRHSADDLRRVLAGRTVGRAFGIDGDAFVFGGGTNRADLGLELQLLFASFVDPGYRPDALRQFEKGIGPFYTKLAHDVGGPLQTEVPRLLANGDVRFGTPAEADVRARSLAEAKAWLAREFANGAVEIAIVGNFEIEAAISAVSKTFGTLPGRTPKPDYDAARKVGFPLVPIEKQFSVSTEIPKGLVAVYWPATDGLNARVSRRLNLLAAVFKDRLRIKLREQMGGTYSPSTGAGLSDTYPGYGFLSASATVEPEKATVVANAIKAVASDLAANGVTEDELQRAKQPLLTVLRQSQRTNSYWLGTVLAAAQEFPQKLEWSRTRLSDNEAITAAELSALAAQYLPPTRASQFISLPETKAK